MDQKIQTTDRLVAAGIFAGAAMFYYLVTFVVFGGARWMMSIEAFFGPPITSATLAYLFSGILFSFAKKGHRFRTRITSILIHMFNLVVLAFVASTKLAYHARSWLGNLEFFEELAIGAFYALISTFWLVFPLGWYVGSVFYNRIRTKLSQG